ncbi:hypothetical protein B0H19DRAFT_1263112 [Mycena capillaripes]|nr:hypothetical protein B0H19DRAFT_1263112 [Mycena capillaripes]
MCSSATVCRTQTDALYAYSLRAEHLVTLPYDGSSEFAPISFDSGCNTTLAGSGRVNLARGHGGGGRRWMRIRPWSLAYGECSFTLMWVKECTFCLPSVIYPYTFVLSLPRIYVYFHFVDDSARVLARLSPSPRQRIHLTHCAPRPRVPAHSDASTLFAPAVSPLAHLSAVYTSAPPTASLRGWSAGGAFRSSQLAARCSLLVTALDTRYPALLYKHHGCMRKQALSETRLDAFPTLPTVGTPPDSFKTLHVPTLKH